MKTKKIKIITGEELEVKIGDELFVSSTYRGKTTEIGLFKVDKIGSKFVTMSNGSKISVESGCDGDPNWRKRVWLSEEHMISAIRLKEKQDIFTMLFSSYGKIKLECSEESLLKAACLLGIEDEYLTAVSKVK